MFDASLSLGPFTLIIGRNGSGKSSAVEAIQWLRDAMFLGLDGATSRYDAFGELVNRRCDTISLDLRYRRDSAADPVHYILRAAEATQRPIRPIVVYERCVVGRTTRARTAVHSRKGKRGPAYRWVTSKRNDVLAISDSNELALKYTKTRSTAGAQDLVDFLERAVFLRLSPTAIAAPSRVEPQAWRPLLSDDGHDLASLLLRMPADRRDRIASRLRAIFPGVEGLTVRSVGQERRFEVRERMPKRGGTGVFSIPSSLLSEGMRRLVAIFALLEADPPPALLVIEEIENGLDPWTLEHVLDALREVSGTIQVLLTTHSPFLLDHIHANEVIHVRRDRGETSYQPISELEETARYDRVLAPGAMYLANVFDESGPSTHGGT